MRLFDAVADAAESKELSTERPYEKRFVTDAMGVWMAYQAQWKKRQIEIGMWRPFAKLVWNHELASTDRSVTASLTTVAAPSYWMPAVVLGRDWSTGTVGTTVSAIPASLSPAP